MKIRYRDLMVGDVILGVGGGEVTYVSAPSDALTVIYRVADGNYRTGWQEVFVEADPLVGLPLRLAEVAAAFDRVKDAMEGLRESLVKAAAGRE